MSTVSSSEFAKCLFAIVLVSIGTLSGCSSSDQFGTIKAEGTVTLSIVREISGIGFQPVGVKSQARSLCHNEESTVIFRSMLNVICNAISVYPNS